MPPGPKKAQRTKGNAKPSSSSQAAQLLAASGHSVSGGFIGFSQQPAYVPVSDTFEDSDSALDADFRLTLRKLSKRDTVTKIKALQEFAGLCADKDEEVVKAVIPFWPRIYNKVAIDVDHKVRELSQKATAALAGRVGKAMAPHLKGLMGMWVVSMCDTYPTVASAATQAFTGRFPGPRQGEVFRFCLDEIVECLEKNVTSHTKQTLSDPQTTSAEDMEAKYQRVVTSSLHGMRKLLVTLPADKVAEAMAGHMTSLLENSAFWRHAKSAEPLIRGGLLSLLSGVCQVCPAASGPSLAKIAPFVFSLLDCVEPSVVPYVWEAVLSVISAHEDCWQHVNWQKAVWPKVKKVLESGCSGQATIIGPCLLPFLNKTPNKNFPQFLESFRLGLVEESAQNSQSELNAVMKSFLECVQYSVKNLAAEKKQQELRDLVMDQLLTVVQGSLTHTKMGLSRTGLYASLAPFLATVCSADADTEKNFWSDLSAFIFGHLLVEFEQQRKAEKNVRTTTPALFRKLVLLVQGLVEGPSDGVSQTAKTGRSRVKFDMPDADEADSGQAGEDERQKADMSGNVENFSCDLLVAVFTLAGLGDTPLPEFFSLFAQLAGIHIPRSAPLRLKERSDKVAVRIADDLALSPASPDLENPAALPTQIELREDDSCGHFLAERAAPLLLQSERLGCEQSSFSLVQALFTFLPLAEESAAQQIAVAVLENTSNLSSTCQVLEKILCTSKSITACQKVCEQSSFAAHIEKLFAVSCQAEEGSTAVWAGLLQIVSRLDDTLMMSKLCMDALMSGCVNTLEQLCLNPQSIDMTGVMGLVQAVLEKRLAATHPLLGRLAVKMLPSLLHSHLLQKGPVSSLEQTWLASLCLVLSSKSHLETRDLLGEMCQIIQAWVVTKVMTLSSLESVLRISRLLLSCVLTPEVSTSVKNDSVTARLSSLSLLESTEDGQPKHGQSELDDVQDFTVTVDKLLVEVSTPMEDQEKLYEFLFVSKRLPRLPDSAGRQLTSDELVIPPLSAERIALVSLFNLGLLESASRVIQTPNPTQARCIRQLCGRLVLLGAALETTRKSNCSDLATWLTQIRSKLARCLLLLGQEQIVELASQGDDMQVMAATQLLEGGNQPASLLVLRTSFLSQCTLQEEADRSEVLKVLQEEVAKCAMSRGKSVCTAFSMVVKGQLQACTEEGCDRWEGQLALCISGCLGLAAGEKLLSQAQVRLEMFEVLLDLLEKLKEKGFHLLTSSDSDGNVGEGRLYLNVAVARAMKALLLPGNDRFWEMSLCTLIEWIHFLSEGQEKLRTGRAGLRALAVAVWELTYEAARVFSKPRSWIVEGKGTPANVALDENVGDSSNILVREQSSIVTEKVKMEWAEFFSEGIFSPLLPMFLALAKSSDENTGRESSWSLVVGCLASAVSLCPDDLVLTQGQTTEQLLTQLSPMLAHRQRSVAVAAYLLLGAVIRDMIKQGGTCQAEGGGAEKPKASKEQEEDEDDDAEEEKDGKSPPEALMQQIESSEAFLHPLLLHAVGEHVVMDHGTEERARCRAYLLAWRLVMLLFKSSPADLKADYFLFFKSKGCVSRLLQFLFRLMPASPDPTLTQIGHELEVAVANPGESAPAEPLEELEHLSLQVYTACLMLLPGQARTWWLDLERSPARVVERFTTQNLSPTLVRHQMALLTASQSEGGDLVEGVTVKSRPAARELLATCTMTEVTITLTLTLPENFPLGQVGVSCERRVGVAAGQWERWLRQLQVCLWQQDAGLAQGLRLWKANLDRSFEGLEDCMVCFSVLHPTSLQLPRLTCRTCRHKFHSACLYKWFSSSQKSSCPLCRELF